MNSNSLQTYRPSLKLYELTVLFRFVAGFMLKGLQETEKTLRSLNIPFHLLMGDPVLNIPQFAATHRALAIVCDFSPLRTPRQWVHQVGIQLDGLDSDISSHHITKSLSSSSVSSSELTRLKIPLVQVDAHNVVPCWLASDKQARVIIHYSLTYSDNDDGDNAIIMMVLSM